MMELEAVSVQRGGATVLDGVTLQVGPEVVVLVGPSGSGKSTLLRVLLGLERPSAGRVRLDGRTLSRGREVLVPPEGRNVAMVFQDLALWPHLTVEGNLAFGLRAQGLGRAARTARIGEALAWVGLGDLARRHPDQLSGGERQRVAIARALVLRPAALLLDEPLGSLDVALKEDLQGVFARLFAERGLPVLYVTHDPAEARRLARRVVVLERGSVTQAGTPAELAAAPATPFVAALVRGWGPGGPSAVTPG